MKHILTVLLLLGALFYSTCDSALAKGQDASAFYDYMSGYSEDGFLFTQNDLLCYFDYSTGLFLPVCTHPECKHTLAGWNSDEYASILDMLNDSSVCFAARMGKASDMGMKHLQWKEKIYSLDCWIDPVNETGEVCIYESTVDGETRLLASPGEMLPGNQQVSCGEFLISEGYMYFPVVSAPFSWNIEEGQGADSITETVYLFQVSLVNGETAILHSVSAQKCSMILLGIVDDVLYYRLTAANGFVPLEQCESVDEWHEGYQNKARSSILGISTKNRESITLDSRLCDRASSPLGFSFDTVKDGILYSINAASEDSAMILEYDLCQRKMRMEYPFRYESQKELYPYRVLTDEMVLAFDFETGEFALRNLKTGEIKTLAIPGICIHGNTNQTDWYDINGMNIQTDPIVLDHVFSDGRTVKAFITAEELLKNNPQIHDYINGNRYE